MRSELRDYNRFHQRNSRRRERARLIGVSARVAGSCWTCGAMACRRRTCRAIRAFAHQRGFHRAPHMFGELFPLWATIAYLQAMACGAGDIAVQFGKRYAHRRAA